MLAKAVDALDDSKEFHTVRGYQLMDQQRRMLTPAMEDYIEMIYRNNLMEGYMRINSLAEMLHVQPPSATRMVQRLAKLELVNYKKYGILSLTKKGMELGKFLYDRHNIVEAFLRNLGAAGDTLTETELIEHSISAGTTERLRMITAFLQENPQFMAELIRRYYK